MEKIKNIIFDFGAVLIDWNPRYLYKKLFKTEEEMNFFLSKVCHMEWNAQMDKGMPFSEGINERIQKFPEYEDMIRMYYDGWIKMVGGEIKENTVLVPALKKSYKVYGLTNWSEETFPLVYPKYDFFKYFDGIVMSGEEKEIKPEPQIFEILLVRYNLNPEECLFIDDNYSNIETASKMGFNCIHYSSELDLLAELNKLGIL